MVESSVKTLLDANQSSIALVIGNGINRYAQADSTNSWDGLIVELANEYGLDISQVPDGLSLTEFYDILALRSPELVADIDLQRHFCQLMNGWQHYEHHQRIVQWAIRAETPILTTNFDAVLAGASQGELFSVDSQGFTDFYPWQQYYGNQQITKPENEFGIWHINGMQHYARSIRLGLSHYMGSVDRARSWISNEQGLFVARNQHNWLGHKSWLHIVFNCPLLIFGLGLNENEVFLRWLLIQRARYFKHFPKRKQPAWFVEAGQNLGLGKQFFLKGVGVEPVLVPSFDDIYGAAVWS